MKNCPECKGKMIPVMKRDALGKRLYYKCVDCGKKIEQIKGKAK